MMVVADQAHQRRQRGRAGAYPIGQRGHAQVEPCAGKTLGLPVQRLMLAEFAVEDFGQQTRAGAATGDRMEWCRWLGNRLARAAGEFLMHRFDHSVAARNALQGFGDALAEFGQLAAAAGASGRARQHHTLARQMRRQRAALRLFAGEGPDAARVRPWLRCRYRRGVLGQRGFEFLELQFQLIEQFAATFGRGAEPVTPHLGDHQFQMSHHRLRARGPGIGFKTRGALSQQRGLQHDDVIRQEIDIANHAHHRIIPHRDRARCFFAQWQTLLHHPALSGRQVRCGCRQSMPSSM